MKNCIDIQLKRNEVWIKIKESAQEKDIYESLNEKIVDLKKLCRGENVQIKVKGKALKNREIAEIQEIIEENIDVNVEFDTPKVLGLHGIKRTFNQEIEASETNFHRGGLRSGQRVEAEGSLVIIGDVNSGAEVIAGENIIVLGEIRGLAHAGAKGNTKAIIACNRIDCPQIRIADKIKEFERAEMLDDEIKSYVYVENDEIIVE